jgi:short-subunit dehydrogenase
LAKLFAQDHYDLVLVARREKLLQELAQELESQYQTKSFIIKKDLSQLQAAKEIFEELEETDITVTTLCPGATQTSRDN